MPVRAGQLFQRHEGNPILTPDQWPYTVNAVFNPGATMGPDGDTVLLVRVEDRSGLSHLTVARSDDGLTDWDIDLEPSLQRDPGTYSEHWGLEDPRITKIDDRYLITHTSLSRGGPLVSLTATRDFRSFERLTVVTTPENKDAALFPVQFDGRFALIHRPVYTGPRPEAHIWISFSPDLRHWGDHQILIESRAIGYWDRERVGLGPPPLLTEQGWLLLYHGVRQTAAGALYRAGLALLDREEPTKVIARTDEWVLGPEADYELRGDVPGVVFPCGWIADDAGNIRLYYGAADSCVAVATARIDDLVAFSLSHSYTGE